jgi:hypothetical protein
VRGTNIKVSKMGMIKMTQTGSSDSAYGLRWLWRECMAIFLQ